MSKNNVLIWNLLIMSINEDLRVILLKECLTIKALAEKANKSSNRRYTADGISQKLNKGTMKYNEAQFLADVLGYKLEFVKK
ncbi:phosphoribosylglycinamide formyltransferase [Candidatus Gastranaerophilales bacterium]|nr:MAG: phosphoribosylglycinamide formyltransferase [Candidatus Gastranaerophilales bacterium]